MTLAYELSELYKPSLNRHKGKLIELLKGEQISIARNTMNWLALRKHRSINIFVLMISENVEKVSKSEIARKMRVAKGFYQLEMAPPTGSEMEVSYRY